MSEPQDDPAAARPEAEAAPPPPAEPTPDERAAALEAALAEMRERWIRAEAELQNLRARSQREVADARAYAVQKFAADVAEAADNLRRGLDSLPAPAADEPELLAKLRGGFAGVERAFLAILERNGVARHDPTGQAFDPERHQAMAEQPAGEGQLPGTVVAAWTPAWTLNGRLLRPAMVVVAGPAQG